MGIDSFADIVKDSVETRLGKKHDVMVRKIDKNNGVVYTGLCITKNNTTVSPIIYLNDYYEMYQKGGMDFAAVTDGVLRSYNRKEPKLDIKYFLNYELAQDRIIYKLINTERNREALEDIPHIDFLDLSIVFQCLVADEDYGMASMLIHNAHLKLWNVSVDDLYKAAMENTPKLCGYEVKSIKQVIGEIMRENGIEENEDSECMDEFGEQVPMYVLKNRQGVGGASCILYPCLLKNISERFGSSFYIIPSSIHEQIIVLSDDTQDSGTIREMIKEINDTQVRDEEVLSYSLYYYDRESDEVSILSA